jgi:hypothetical protein
MGNNAESPTLAEALATISRHFIEPVGIIGKVERGEGFDKAEVQELEIAFRVVESTWQERVVIPKETARLILHVKEAFPKLEQSMLKFPQHEEAVGEFIIKLENWIEQAFSPSSMAEANALSMVGQHLFGTRPFIQELIRGSVDEEALKELLDALKTLRNLWESKVEIPKFGVYAMIAAPSLFDSVVNAFPGEEQQHLQNVRQEVMTYIERCVS